jgi:hypothetical protein
MNDDKKVVDIRNLRGIERDTLEKMRGNALVAAILALGGELTITEEVKARTRHHQVFMEITDAGPRFFVRRKP